MIRHALKLITGRSSFLRGVRITVGAQALMIGINSFTGVVAARLLGPSGRGELAVATLWTFTLVSLAAFGVNQSIVYFTGNNRAKVSEVLGASIGIGALQSIVVLGAGYILLELALRNYRPEVRHLGILFLASAPLIILGGYPGNVLQGLLKFKSFNAIRLLPSAFYASGLVFLFVLRDHQLSHVLDCQILGLVAAFVIGWWILTHHVPLRWQWNREVSEKLAWFGAKTQLGNVSTFVNKSSDQLILSLFVSPRDLGLYVVAVTVSTAIVFLPQALGIATLAQAANQDRASAVRTVSHAAQMAFLWLAGAALILLISAHFLITAVFGSRFEGSTLACQILLPGAIAWGLNQVLYEGAFALGYPVLPSYAEAVGTVVTVVGLIVLLPELGFMGAAIVSTIAYTTSCIVMLAFYKRKMHVDIRPFFKLSVATPRMPEQVNVETL